jgi:lauroyl/myristoyl acyltransferase
MNVRLVFKSELIDLVYYSSEYIPKHIHFNFQYQKFAVHKFLLLKILIIPTPITIINKIITTVAHIAIIAMTSRIMKKNVNKIFGNSPLFFKSDQ